MLKQDWLLTQIEQTFRLIVLFFFGKKDEEEMEEEYTLVQDSKEYQELIDLVRKNEFCEAEDRFVEMLDEEGELKDKVLIGYLMYREMAKVDERVLNENNFSRQEVREGVDMLEEILLERGIVPVSP